MRRAYIMLILAMLTCIGCQWQLKPGDADLDNHQLRIERYDRIESLYLTTGDYSALQQMNTAYPIETRMLLEDVLRIGKVNDPDINRKFLHFFQDSTLQVLISAVQEQFSDIDDINSQLAHAFQRMKEELPALDIPRVYAQIGSFDQSIIVGRSSLGISLDKYLGADYPFYQEHYPERERSMMVRSMIVPDCLGFYLLSVYPLEHPHIMSQGQRDMHIGKIQWVVNQLLDKDIFDNDHVTAVEEYMKKHKQLTYDQLLVQGNI
ncbi:MAG: gliding motility protein GldB [Prevotella sp.]|nr:gliding motility protein GldB [Prevotella sp.]